MKSVRVVCLAVLVLVVALAASADAPAAVRVGDSGWFWGNPLQHGNTLRDVEFAGRRGYAVGDAGAVLRSDDAGETWSGLASGGPVLRGGSLNEIDVMDADSFVVPTAEGCTLRRSDDGGRTFRRLRLVPRGTRCPGDIDSFSFPTQGVGYIVIDSGIVFRTADGGASFVRRAPVPAALASGGEPAGLRLHFVSASTGFAVSDGSSAGRIHRTVDGGVTWTQVASQPNGLRAIEFADLLTGYAVGEGGTILKTINGGANWSRPPLVGTGPSEEVFADVDCAGSQTCLFGRTSGYPLRTINGGASVTNGGSLPASDVLEMTSGARAIALGAEGVVAVSDDNGASFRRTDRRLPAGLTSLRASSPLLAVAYGPPGQLIITQDGGRSWRGVGVPSAQSLDDVSFPSASTGYVLEERGTILRTRNGGLDWQDAAGVPASGLLARGENVVLVAGSGGVRRSTDGAASFRRMSARALRGTRLGKLDPAGAAVFAFGDRALARSTNDGRSWRRIRRPTGAEITDADFVNSRTGYVILEAGGAGQRLYKTTSAGRRWRLIRSLGTRELYSVSFATARSGMVDADNDTARVLRTSDGGRTWRPQVIAPTTLSVDGLLATGPGTALAADISGELFATTTGGDAAGASSLTLRSSRRRLRRAGRVTISGRLTPNLADEQIVLATLVRGRWRRRTTTTEPDGRFSLRIGVRRSSRFVAQWDGDGSSRGAGTAPVLVRVRR